MEIKGIIGVKHVVLKVRDLEKARQFYCGVLGMKIGNYDPERGMFLRFNDYQHDIAIFRTGPDADPPKENQVGLVHVALLVDSLETVPSPTACTSRAPLRTLSIARLGGSGRAGSEGSLSA